MSVGDHQDVPDEIRLYPHYPVPSSASVTLDFAIPEDGPLHIELFDIQGRKVDTVFQGFRVAGRHRVVVPTHNLPSGMYLYQIHTASSHMRKPLIVRH